MSQEPTDIRDSTPGSTGPARAAGEMGVSSEREGPTGPGQHATDGVRDTSPAPVDPEDAPPEQSAGGPEDNPEGIEPRPDHPSADPRS